MRSIRREINIWFIVTKDMANVPPFFDEGRNVVEEGAAGDVTDAPLHRYELEVGLRDVDVVGSGKDAVVVVPC